jgi:hypothetical protein
MDTILYSMEISTECALSLEGDADAFEAVPLARVEPVFDGVGVIDALPATPKRTRSAALEIMLEPDMGALRSSKRRRLAEERVKSIMLEPISTPQLTPPPTPLRQRTPGSFSERPRAGSAAAARQGRRNQR